MVVLMKKLMECSSTEFGQLYSPDTLQRLPPNTAWNMWRFLIKIRFEGTDNEI